MKESEYNKNFKLLREHVVWTHHMVINTIERLFSQSLVPQSFNKINLKQKVLLYYEKYHVKVIEVFMFLSKPLLSKILDSHSSIHYEKKCIFLPCYFDTFWLMFLEFR